MLIPYGTVQLVQLISLIDCPLSVANIAEQAMF